MASDVSRVLGILKALKTVTREVDSGTCELAPVLQSSLQCVYKTLFRLKYDPKLIVSSTGS